jgi:pseudouridine synthase
VNERLQKILARAGYGSRRSAEALITAGRVRVNGATVRELGAQADHTADRIEVDGKTIAIAGESIYLAMHKPPGYVTTVHDPQDRPTVMSLLPNDLPPHLLPVGRLDRDTEGLLIFTNDGEFAHRLAHPRYEIEKEYAALVVGSPTAAALERLRQGVEIDGRRTSPAQVNNVPPPLGHFARDGHAWLRLVIHEGRKRQVRLMTAAVGHQVRVLVRTRIGSVALGTLARGATRSLTKREMGVLRRAVGM